MKQITSKDGTLIAFWKSGVGRPLLLVHGTTADHRRWNPIILQFEQYFTVYNMDRRGRGGSGDSPDYHLLREAEDIAAVIESIDQSVSVLAHSYGAVCSLEASILTNNIDRLILYEPPIPTGLSMYPPGLPDKIQAAADSGNLEHGLELFMRGVVKMPDHELSAYRQLDMWPNRIKLAPTIAREMTLDRTYQFQPEKFANHQIPTLLLLGGDSPPLFQQAIQTLEATFSNSQTVILPGQQHIAMDTAPELFMKRVLEFLHV